MPTDKGPAANPPKAPNHHALSRSPFIIATGGISALAGPTGMFRHLNYGVFRGPDQLRFTSNFCSHRRTAQITPQHCMPQHA